jgi:hypothetical protein
MLSSTYLAIAIVEFNELSGSIAVVIDIAIITSGLLSLLSLSPLAPMSGIDIAIIIVVVIQKDRWHAHRCVFYAPQHNRSERID